MTEPNDFELLELATPYALNAVSDTERDDIERRLAAAPAAVADAFRAEVRSIRETMAAVSVTTQVEPPADLRQRVIAAVGAPTRRKHWRTAALAAAAVLVVALSVLSAVLALRPSPPPSTEQQVIAAADLKTVSEPIPAGGTATILYSRDKNAGVLVMTDVAPPPPHSVYQMWLIDNQKPKSAGTMSAQVVHPATTAVLNDLGPASALAFTVEPGTGSPQPTGQIFLKLPLT
ncbi:MAG TPA: anti-sigma factor [Mycobacterium sp.]|nr:anti-sigma factor [Mycobacterium sp.]